MDDALIITQIHDPAIRLVGRLDETQSPICLDWTGSGFEVCFEGGELWVELEASVRHPDMWVCCAVDGAPVTRFMVQEGCHLYPLVYGMDKTLSRRITLMKETQAMPRSPEATIKVHSIRHDGKLLPLPEPSLTIEFIGDSLTSAEGALAPKDNTEWLSMWFTAAGNYTHYCCEALGAQRRVLSQSGRGVYWDYTGNRKGNMADDYETICGVLKGESAEARGCNKPYDFTKRPADLVCIRLLSNDAGGLKKYGDTPECRQELIDAAAAFAQKVRACNPQAYILWILPRNIPQIGEATVKKCLNEGMRRISAFPLPALGPDDRGARNHPNAEYNRRVGLLLAEHIRELIDSGAINAKRT